MSNPRILIFAYSEMGYACLQEILHQQANVIAIFTHPDSPNENIWFHSVAQLAQAHDIPVYYEPITQPESHRTIQQLQPELIFSFYYRHLIPESILKLPHLGAFNLHGSLLPKYRGRAPINWAILHGEKETGATLHVMVKQPDAGDIVDQERVTIDPFDTAHVVYIKVVAAAQKIIRRQLPALLTGQAPRIPQDPAQATYFTGRKPEDGLIDWHQPNQTIFNLIRAVTKPYPGAFTYYQGSPVFIWWAIPTEGTGHPGEVISLSPFTVATGTGALEIKEWEWGIPNPAAHTLKPGKMLGF